MAGWDDTKTGSSLGTASRYGVRSTKEIMEILNEKTVPGKTAPVGKQIIPLSTTIADYNHSLSNPVVSSIDLSDFRTVQQLNGGSAVNLDSDSETRAGIVFKSGAAELGNTVTEVSVWLKKNNSPTGTAIIGIYNSTGVLQNQFGTIDVSTLTASFVKHTFTTGSHILAAGDVLAVEYNDGDTTDSISPEFSLANDYDGNNAVRGIWNSGPSWVESTTVDLRFEMKIVDDSSVSLNDDDTATTWKSASESDPNCHVDLGTEEEIAAIAIHYNSETTVSQIKVRASTDETFDDTELLRTILTSNLTDDTWEYILINRPDSKRRYVQISGVGTGFLALNEIKVRTLTESEYNRLHQHKTIANNDTALQANGDP